MLYCIYLGQNGDTLLISNLYFENNSGRKWQETIYKGNIILDSLKGISRWEFWIGVPKNTPYLLVCNTCKEYQLRASGWLDRNPNPNSNHNPKEVKNEMLRLEFVFE